MGVVRAAQIAGVLYVCRNAVQVVLSFPIGAMADRVGHARVLGGGYVVGATTALLTALAFWYDIKSVSMLVGVFLLVGLYVAVAPRPSLRRARHGERRGEARLE